MQFSEDELDTLKNALHTALQDTIDYADPRDYPGGELDMLVAKQARLLIRMGGSLAGVGGRNGDLLDDVLPEKL